MGHRNAFAAYLVRRRVNGPELVLMGLHHLPLVLIAAVVMGLAWRFVDPPTLWFDEAMLFVNVRDIRWRELFMPLPFYDQVAPVAYIALLKGIYSVTGLQEAALRLPSWLALVATLALIARLPDVDRTTRILTAAMVAGSILTARLATDAKPYMLEVMFAFAMIHAFHPSAKGLWASTSLRLVLLGAAMLFTTAFPLVAFAVGAPLIVSLARSDIGALRRPRQWHCLKPAAIFAGALTAYLLYFANYLSPSLKLVAANHAYYIEAFGFADDDVSYFNWLAVQFHEIVASHWPTRPAIICAVASGLYGSWLLARRSNFYLPQAACLASFALVANAAGHFPLLPGRFSVFMLPWLALVSATGMAFAMRTFLQSNFRSAIAFNLCAALMLMHAAHSLRNPLHEQARASVDHVRQTPQIPLASTTGSQPIIDAYLVPANSGARCHVVAAISTTTRCTAIRTAAHGSFQGYSTNWYLMNYARVYGWNSKLGHAFPGASLKSFTASYYDWLIANIRRQSRAHLLIFLDEGILSELRKRLRPSESITRLIDERPNDRKHGAAQLFLYEGPSASTP